MRKLFFILFSLVMVSSSAWSQTVFQCQYTAGVIISDHEVRIGANHNGKVFEMILDPPYVWFNRSNRSGIAPPGMDMIEGHPLAFTANNIGSGSQWVASFEDGYLIVSSVSFGNGGEDNQGSTVSAVCEMQ